MALCVLRVWTAYSLRLKYCVDSLKIHPSSFAGICSLTHSPRAASAAYYPMVSVSRSVPAGDRATHSAGRWVVDQAPRKPTTKTKQSQTKKF